MTNMPGPGTGGACCSNAAGPAELAPVDGRFCLTDHHGNTVDDSTYGGRLLLVFFGFTHCATVCPRQLAKLSTALELLGGDAGHVQPLYVTVDPRRDDPQRLRSFLAARAPVFTGLTGSPEQIAEVKRRFRVFAAEKHDPLAPGGYTMPHTALTYLLAPGGAYLTHFSEVMSADDVATRVREYLPRAR